MFFPVWERVKLLLLVKFFNVDDVARSVGVDSSVYLDYSVRPRFLLSYSFLIREGWV